MYHFTLCSVIIFCMSNSFLLACDSSSSTPSDSAMQTMDQSTDEMNQGNDQFNTMILNTDMHVDHDLMSSEHQEDQVAQDHGDEVDQMGSYQVGYHTEDIQIQNIVTESERTVRVALWYPTPEAGDEYATYPVVAVRQRAWKDVPVALDSKAPLLLYSHGSIVFPEMGAFMAEFFASHGWIVAAVEHTGNTLTNAIEDRPDEIYAQRPSDVSQVLDWLLSLEAGHKLANLVDSHSIVVSGHSFGGYTSFALAGAHYDVPYLQNEHCLEKEESLCDSLQGRLGELLMQGARDERIKVSIPQSAGNFDFFRQGTHQVQIPTLMITATRDQASTESGSNQPYWQALSEANSNDNDELNQIRLTHRRLSFLQAGHATFTVACEHFPTLEQDDGCGEDFTPVLEAQAVMLSHALAFSRWHLWQDQAAYEYLQNDAHRPSWTQWLTSPARSE